MSDIKKVHFAVISFTDKYQDVTLVQAFRSHGAVIECAICEADVDGIIDSPELHEKSCNIFTGKEQKEWNYTFRTREEARKVFALMQAIAHTFSFVTVADLKCLVGFPYDHVDSHCGWMILSRAEIKKVHDYFILKLPAPGFITPTS